MSLVNNDLLPSNDSFAILRDGTNLAYKVFNIKKINDEVPLVMIMVFFFFFIS